MAQRTIVVLFLTAILLSCVILTTQTTACCPASSFNKPVVNADQTVILIWDAARQTQHFIRKASFASEADDFGFIVPSPNQPELEESGNEAFALLAKLTEPEVRRQIRPISFGCSAHLPTPNETSTTPPWSPVNVLEKKEVAGFNATVLDAKSSNALLGWLKENGYNYSAEVEIWAKPYIEKGWKFTALKVAKGRKNNEKSGKSVEAGSLRISFKTARPLFPYREPDPRLSAQALGVKERLLRIYFIADARYRGDLTDATWTGKAVWAGRITDGTRRSLLAALKLPNETGPAGMWLTEFEDRWPYQAAVSDLFFFRDQDQKTLRREPIIQYVSSDLPVDGSLYALGAVILLPSLVRRTRRWKSSSQSR
jgi:hypothetical protein